MVLQCKDKIDNKDKAIISRDENVNILSEKCGVLSVSVSQYLEIYIEVYVYVYNFKIYLIHIYWKGKRYNYLWFMEEFLEFK